MTRVWCQKHNRPVNVYPDLPPIDKPCTGQCGCRFTPEEVKNYKVTIRMTRRLFLPDETEIEIIKGLPTKYKLELRKV